MALLVLFVFGGARSPVAAAERAPFVLSEEERVYLDALKARPILLAYSYDLVNASFDGERLGMLEPLLAVLRDEFSLTVELVKTNWHDAFLQVESGEVDFYGPIAISEARRKKYITVDPFYRSYSKVMTRINTPVRSMLGLYNRSIGLLEGSVISRTMQAYLGPNGRTIYFPTMEEMIEGLQYRKIDAFATVDNAEFEILKNEGIQFEFSIDNFYVDQGLISGREEMRTLSELLNRYIKGNPQVGERVVALRREALLRHSRERLSEEIASLRAKHEEVVLYADQGLYPLCYMEDGVVRGMQVEINEIFTDLTGIGVRFGMSGEFPNEISSAMERLKRGDCLAIIGGYYDIDAWADPDVQYSPILWLETMRTYAYKPTGGTLAGKTMGATRFSTDYLGWNNTTNNPPVMYDSRDELIRALKADEVDVVFMGEMRFNYGYSVQKDYGLREIAGISAEAPMHVLYGARNRAFNALYNESMMLFQILNPTSLGRWKGLSDKYKSDFIRMREMQQVWIRVAAVVFIVMLIALVYLFLRNVKAHKSTKERLVDALDKAHYDALTGIYNRRYLEENLKRVIKSCARVGGELSVLMIDVDCFKKYNDNYGHSEGDACLRFIAAVIKNSMSRADDFVARYGGEEFAVILPNTDESGARVMANRILENIRLRAMPHETSDVADHVTASIGVTSSRVSYAQAWEAYIGRADEALYDAKRGGRDRYTYLPLREDDGSA